MPITEDCDVCGKCKCVISDSCYSDGKCQNCGQSYEYDEGTHPVLTDSQKAILNACRVSGTESEVIRDIALRQQKGIAKYGQTVRENPLVHKQWLQHAYEEALDLAIYLKRAMEEIGHA